MNPSAHSARRPRPEIAEAEALHRAGNLQEAEDICRRWIADPVHGAAALRRLGLVELSHRRFESAIHVLAAAVKADPDSAPAANELGNAYAAAGRTAEALASYRQSIAVDPLYAAGHYNAGICLQKLGRFAEAVLCARRAAELAPEWPAAHHRLGCALTSAQRLSEAAEALAAAVRLGPELAESWRDLAACLAELFRFEEAQTAIERAIVLAPAARELRLRRAELLFRQGDHAGAAAAFEQETVAEGAGVEAWNGLARVRLSLGDFAGGASALHAGLALQPGHPDSLRLLTLIGHEPRDERRWKMLQATVSGAGSAPRERIVAGFALGEMLDDAGRTDEAFFHFASANAALIAERAAAGRRFSRAKFRAAVDRLLAEPEPPSAWIDSELPVFVLGMPRSGTSLVEQIAASHPDVFGAGELTHFHALARTRQAPAAAWSAAHLSRLQALAPGASRVIDKTPDNLFHLGLIARCFARPRIVLCVRDPRDICLSCFFTYFPTGNLWSSDLEDCGVRCAGADRLARRWSGSRLIRLHVVRYETLVADLEGESRRLIAFLGLPWDDACLRFDRTVRPVATPSFWQVRQPVYERSVGRWRRYEAHLGPLWNGLGPLNAGPSEPM